MASRTKHDRLQRLAQLKDDLRPAKDRLMSVLAVLENERLGASFAKRLGTIIGKLEDLQRHLP
jgi:hypothetical protein